MTDEPIEPRDIVYKRLDERPEARGYFVPPVWLIEEYQTYVREAAARYEARPPLSRWQKARWRMRTAIVNRREHIAVWIAPWLDRSNDW